MSIATGTGDQRVVLRNVSWQTLNALLEEMGDRPIRIAYDRGELELMSPSREHERCKHLLGRLIAVLTEELDIALDGCGSMTFRKDGVERAVEPDECYYILHEPQVRGKRDLDLAVDPPPDLAVEIDISSSSINRMAIYAELRVPELWRFNGEALRVFHLGSDGQYVQRDYSLCFPQLPLSVIERFLNRRNEVHVTQLVKEFRAWVRANIARDLPSSEQPD
ncbi:MAG: Uma2 family endonuclease [Planctomycetes bacterium]|nr:Uma2 family endonuclease [Planctomycetota bacterium]